MKQKHIQNKWTLRLITPNYIEAKNEAELWMSRGYSTHYSKSEKQVEIKKAGPNQALYLVRTRIKL